jgi:hypothetical protein
MNNVFGRLSSQQARTLREAYVDIVTRLNLANAAQPDWWLTWLSSRDRFRARTWDRMVTLARIAAQHRPDHAAVAQGIDVPTAQVLRSWLGVDAMPRRGRFNVAVADAWSFAKVVGLAMVRIVAARRNPARLPSQSIDVIIATILTERAVAREGPYEDVYFGHLHESLAAAGQDVLYCGIPEGSADRIFSAAAARNDTLIAGYAHFFTFVDVARAAVRALNCRFVVPELPLPWGGDAGPLVRADLRMERISIFEGILIRDAMRRLFAQYPKARLINMYENNGWERANYQAARLVTPRRPVTGYLHCAVLRSHLKNRFPREEHALRPMPDCVVTTGEAARDLLLDIGDYPPSMLAVGCGLRSPLLSEMGQLQPIRRPVRTVLALFEGLASIVPGLQLFEQAAKARSDLRFLVRCHPQFPIEALSPAAGVPYGPDEALDVSQPPGLADAVAEADVIAYVGSTSVLYALYGGRPVIKLDVDETIDDDPLTDCPAFKWRAATATDFTSVIDKLNAMTSDDAAAKLREARRYLDSYLREPVPGALKSFMTPLNFLQPNSSE